MAVIGWIRVGWVRIRSWTWIRTWLRWRVIIRWVIGCVLWGVLCFVSCLIWQWINWMFQAKVFFSADRRRHRWRLRMRWGRRIGAWVRIGRKRSRNRRRLRKCWWGMFISTNLIRLPSCPNSSLLPCRRTWWSRTGEWKVFTRYL